MSKSLFSLAVACLSLVACGPAPREMTTYADLQGTSGSVGVLVEEALFTTVTMPEGYRALFVTLGPAGLQCESDLRVYTQAPSPQGRADTRYISLFFTHLVRNAEGTGFQAQPLTPGTYAHSSSCTGSCEQRFALDWLLYDSQGALKGTPHTLRSEDGSATLSALKEGEGGSAMGTFRGVVLPGLGTLSGAFQARWCPPPANG